MKNMFTYFGGRKSGLAFLSIVVPFNIAIIWSYVIKDWMFLKFFSPIAIGGILALAGVNVYQKKVLNGKNNGKS